MSRQTNVRRILFPLFAILFLTTSFAPAGAQDIALDAQLRDELRTILLADPRAASLSETELESMLNALVQEVEEQGVLEDYVLPAIPAFNVEEVSEGALLPWGASIDPMALYVVILICLALAILLLWFLLRMHRKAPPVS